MNHQATFLTVLLFCTHFVLSQNDFGWEKISGMKPETMTTLHNLYNNVDSDGIVKTCFEKCRDVNCTAFIIDRSRSSCVSIKPKDDKLVPESNITFYQRIHINVPSDCKSRLWQVERTLGFILVDSAEKWFPGLTTRRDCYEKCINLGEKCKSARFRTTRELSIEDHEGNCSWSIFSRGSKPQAYRANTYRDEYLENQCHNISKNDFCNYAEYRNSSLPFSDLKINGINANECQKKCDSSNDGFLCRAYSVENPESSQPICNLHSDDSISSGVSSIIGKANVIYREKEPCLNINVRCRNATLVVELRTKEPFFGRIYASGHSDDCGVQGNGNHTTILLLKHPKTEEMNSRAPCGMSLAFSIDNTKKKRAMVWATIVVQFHPIIQRLGDQAVRVGCNLGAEDPLQSRNFTVDSSFTFSDPNAGEPPVVSTVTNSSSISPVVKISILDDDKTAVNVTKLCQRLILKISIEFGDDTFDIKAGHLVASSESGDSSVLLIDEKGCPVDPKVFPPFSKDPSDNRSLIAAFNAFKFPKNQKVVFRVVVHFCYDKCEAVRCKNDVISYGRRRRGIAELKVPGNGTLDELPLETTIVVENEGEESGPTLGMHNRAPDTIILAGKAISDSLFCIHPVLLLGILTLWLLIQIALLISCVYAVWKYKRLAKQAEDDRAYVLARHLYGIHGGNFEIARRVRWADNDSS